MSLSLCLYVCCKHRPLYQNQIFKIPIIFVQIGTEEMCRRQDHSLFGCHRSRSFHVISVLRKRFLGCVFQIFKTFFWENINGCRVIMLLLILYNTFVSVTELFAKDRKYDDLLACLSCRGTRATGIIINNSGIQF